MTAGSGNFEHVIRIKSIGLQIIGTLVKDARIDVDPEAVALLLRQVETNMPQIMEQLTDDQFAVKLKSILELAIQYARSEGMSVIKASYIQRVLKLCKFPPIC
jgi:DNA polymerase III delta subunit